MTFMITSYVISEIPFFTAQGQRCFACSTFDILLALRVDKPKTVMEETMRNYLHGNANLELMLLFPILCHIMYF